MAENDPKKDPAPKPETKVLYNRGVRTFVTSKGNLLPGQSVELPKAEAERLLKPGYRDLSDIAKVAPQAAAQLQRAEDENKRLAQENADLKAKLAEGDEKSKGKGK